jgi:hypothetical protein
MQNADFRVYYKNKEVGKVYINLEFKDSFNQEETKNGNREINQEYVDLIRQPYSLQPRLETEELNYEYAPVQETHFDYGNNSSNPFGPKPVNDKSGGGNKLAPHVSAGGEDRVIAIDASLSPLDANLELNKTALWFKFDSSEVYLFDFD